MSGTQLERSDDSGQFVSDTRGEVFDTMPVDEPVIASEIAEKADLPRTTVNYHLNKLANEDRIEKKKFHERRVVWLRPRSAGKAAPAGGSD